MKPFQVTIISPDSEPTLSMQLHAAHWLDAWKAALSEIGLGDVDTREVRCHIREDGAVEVSSASLGERRYLVQADARGERTTQVHSALPDPRTQSPSITIEEMKAVGLEDLPVEPVTRRTSRRVSETMEGQGVYPAVSDLKGDLEAVLGESTAMLAAHVPAERVLFLVSTESRSCWTVRVDASPEGPPLLHAILSASAPVPGPVSHGLGRRSFEPPSTLTFLTDSELPEMVNLRSALWCGVRRDDVLFGVFVLLNAPRAEGFSALELEAVRKVSGIFEARLAR